jgi:hypothetical protein
VFRRACGNELVVDVSVMRSLGLAEFLPDAIPRPISVSRKLSRWKPAWPWLFRLTSLLWAWLLFPVLLTRQVLQTLRPWWRSPRRQMPVETDVGVVLTARVAEVVRCVPAERRPRVWITTPWQPITLADSAGQAVPLLAYARWSDLFAAAWLAWRGVQIVRRKGLGRWPGGQCRTAILQTYIAWEWFLTWQVLPRALSPTAGIWYANHYDRWAVLLDRLPAGGPRHLVQHGFARDGLGLPHRQRHVTEVCYFDQGTRSILEHEALHPRCRPVWTPIQAKLTLTPWRDEEAQGLLSLGVRKTVLVIGQPVEPDLERELLSALTAALPDAVVLYKAHPLYGRSGADHVPSPPVEILWQRDLFPAVDVVLAGQSWLGVEYESTGTPVVWYKSRPLSEVIRQVQGELTRTATRAA